MRRFLQRSSVMSVDVLAPSRTTALDSAAWSEAQIFDTQITPDLTVRALVCRLPAGSWQWCISSIDGDGGAMISLGVERTAAAARRVAADEVAKSLENAIV